MSNWCLWVLSDGCLVRLSLVKPFSPFFWVMTKDLFPCTRLHEWASRVVAILRVAMVSVQSVVLREPSLWKVCRCGRAAEVRVSEMCNPQPLAVQNQETIHQPVSSMETYSACFNLNRWGLRSGRMRWQIRCCERYGRWRCFENHLFRDNARLLFGGFCSLLRWRSLVYHRSPVLPARSLVAVLVIDVVEASDGLVPSLQHNKDVTWNNKFCSLADFLNDQNPRMLCLIDFWGL